MPAVKILPKDSMNPIGIANPKGRLSTLSFCFVTLSMIIMLVLGRINAFIIIIIPSYFYYVILLAFPLLPA
jgi:hypothetical protein